MTEETQRVGIVGAGALGALYASHFAQCGTLDVFFVAAGSRAERLRKDALYVNGEVLHCNVIDAAAYSDLPMDLIIIAVKHHHLDAALLEIGSLVGKNTLFLSVLNGLQSEEQIAHQYGAEKCLYCVAQGMDAVKEGSSVRFCKSGVLRFGAADNTEVDDRVRRLQVLLDLAGLAHETPPNMLHALWFKFMINVGVNQASAILRANYGKFKTSDDARSLMDALMAEVISISGPAGVHLEEEDMRRWHRILQGMNDEGKTSMLQDVEAGRPTEVDIFAGHVITLGVQYGIATPTNQAVYHILRVLSGEDSERG